jgi:2-methylisocitrate lyase-like PEP mutase family enzyme
MTDQESRGAVFRHLHERSTAFIVANAFDAGSSRILSELGFEAIATSSAGHAFTQARQDHRVGRSEALSHISTIASATNLPVTADLENGFADEPEIVAETVALAAATGIVGASIEDSTGSLERPLYPISFAAERIRAAAEVARSLAFPFMLTARAENFFVGSDDLHDAIRRLQAYQDAGADVLFAPGLSKVEDISTLVREVDLPVNVLVGSANQLTLDLATLSGLGVKRISVGSALARAAYGAVIRGADEMRQRGTFSFAADAVPYDRLNAMFAHRRASEAA